jgi:hypothetical protein
MRMVTLLAGAVCARADDGFIRLGASAAVGQSQ